MLTIGIDASRANLIERTGTEWYSYFLIQELKKLIPNSYRVILYAKEPLRDGLEEMPENWKAAILTWPPKKLWTQIRLSLAMLNPATRPDLLFIPAHTIPIIHPKKTVLVVHDVGFKTHPDLYSQKELKYHNAAMHLAIKYAKQIITVSEFSKQAILSNYAFPAARIKVVHNGFNHSVYHQIFDKENPHYHKLLAQYQIANPYVLYVGRLEQKKNTPRLVEAFSKVVKTHPELKLVLVGRPGYQYSEILKLLKLKNLNNSVIMPGYVPAEDLNVIMNFAKLFIFPSRYEGFGIPLLEAFSVGVPVLAADIPALREVGGNAAQYFNPDDTQELADKIIELLRDSELQKHLIEHSMERLKLFSWKKCAADTWETLKQQL